MKTSYPMPVSHRFHLFSTGWQDLDQVRNYGSTSLHLLWDATWRDKSRCFSHADQQVNEL